MQIQVQVNQVGPTTSEGVARSHHVLVDRPLDKGGHDQGMMGGEHLLIALGGCLMSNLLAAAQAREADIQGVRFEIVGTLESAPSRFGAIDILVQAQAADSKLLSKLVEMADRACIASNTLRSAVQLTIRVADQSLASA
ncbi:OsmC family protein [Deinococcus sp. QL22]|uniref:OsmC family protein n=1 Tax=Deinococcus sp. QL22 TaxID=2939437 RepID=UPI002016D5B3|nr:OsmC family protein [Deinococcus sp. QL22]UQN08901.1 OsmC family protein [Deinococcus sp. QL22]